MGDKTKETTPVSSNPDEGAFDKYEISENLIDLGNSTETK